jgi:hypothetical protein
LRAWDPQSARGRWSHQPPVGADALACLHGALAETERASGLYGLRNDVDELGLVDKDTFRASTPATGLSEPGPLSRTSKPGAPEMRYLVTRSLDSPVGIAGFAFRCPREPDVIRS